MLPKLSFMINCIGQCPCLDRLLNYNMTLGQTFRIRFEEDTRGCLHASKVVKQ